MLYLFLHTRFTLWKIYLISQTALPESLFVHVILRDSIVRQRLVPVRIQRLVSRLCSQFVGLQAEKNIKYKILIYMKLLQTSWAQYQIVLSFFL